MKTPNRREFLAASALGAAGLSSSVAAATTSGDSRPPLARSCIFINMIGGPSHLDTFDPKPTANSDDRGPFRPISTSVPGMRISELFPRMAAIADRFTLLRGMHHNGPPVHEAGLQLLNTGRLFRDGVEWPNVGAVVANLFEERNLYPSWWMMPGREITTGINVGRGLSSGFAQTPDFCPVAPELADASFDIVCVCAETAVRSGARVVTINQFDTVFDSPSWDCHADRGSLCTTLADIRDTVAPSFDAAFASLITDLESRGLLDSTLVIATGEFGRTPWFNCNGGRDHWANAWTAIVAGGGTQGGRVIGATDRAGAEVADRPTTPQELVATIFHALGVPANATIPGPDGSPVAVYPGKPISELF